MGYYIVRFECHDGKDRVLGRTSLKTERTVVEPQYASTFDTVADAEKALRQYRCAWIEPGQALITHVDGCIQTDIARA